MAKNLLGRQIFNTLYGALLKNENEIFYISKNGQRSQQNSNSVEVHGGFALHCTLYNMVKIVNKKSVHC